MATDEGPSVTSKVAARMGISMTNASNRAAVSKTGASSRTCAWTWSILTRPRSGLTCRNTPWATSLALPATALLLVARRCGINIEPHEHAGCNTRKVEHRCQAPVFHVGASVPCYCPSSLDRSSSRANWCFMVTGRVRMPRNLRAVDANLSNASGLYTWWRMMRKTV